MRLGFTAVLASAAIAACAPPAPVVTPSPSGTPATTTTMLPSEPSWKGRWLVGTGQEPPPGPVTWTGAQGQAKIQVAVLFPAPGRLRLESFDWCSYPPDEVAEGTWENQQVRLSVVADPYATSSPAPLEYELTYHPETHHFTGKRNGEPVWIAEDVGVYPSQAAVCGTFVQGDVFDEAGAPVPDGIVRVRSLDVNAPFETTKTFTNGRFRVHEVPNWTEVEVTVSRVGWISRQRVMTTHPVRMDRIPNQVNFGGPLPGDAAFAMSREENK